MGHREFLALGRPSRDAEKGGLAGAKRATLSRGLDRAPRVANLLIEMIGSGDLGGADQKLDKNGENISKIKAG